MKAEIRSLSSAGAGRGRFTAAEVQRMLRTKGGTGEYFSVSDEPSTGPGCEREDRTRRHSRQRDGRLIGCGLWLQRYAKAYRRTRQVNSCAGAKCYRNR
jgi:hypothetical protein